MSFEKQTESDEIEKKLNTYCLWKININNSGMDAAMLSVQEGFGQVVLNKLCIFAY